MLTIEAKRSDKKAKGGGGQESNYVGGFLGG